MGNQILMAVPLFVFMGVMLERSRIADELLTTMSRLFGSLRGGLAISVILVGMLFGANIIANNASLIFVSLSLNQCLKASSPVLMIFVAYLVEGKKTTPSAAAAALRDCLP